MPGFERGAGKTGRFISTTSTVCTSRTRFQVLEPARGRLRIGRERGEFDLLRPLGNALQHDTARRRLGERIEQGEKARAGSGERPGGLARTPPLRLGVRQAAMLGGIGARPAERRFQLRALLVEAREFERIPTRDRADRRTPGKSSRGERHEPPVARFPTLFRPIRQQVEPIESYEARHCITSRSASPNATAKSGECRSASSMGAAPLQNGAHSNGSTGQRKMAVSSVAA